MLVEHVICYCCHSKSSGDLRVNKKNQFQFSRFRDFPTVAMTNTGTFLPRHQTATIRFPLRCFKHTHTLPQPPPDPSPNFTSLLLSNLASPLECSETPQTWEVLLNPSCLRKRLSHVPVCPEIQVSSLFYEISLTHCV